MNSIKSEKTERFDGVLCTMYMRILDEKSSFVFNLGFMFDKIIKESNVFT